MRTTKKRLPKEALVEQFLTGKLSRFCFAAELQAEHSLHVGVDGIDRTVAIDGLQ